MGVLRWGFSGGGGVGFCFVNWLVILWYFQTNQALQIVCFHSKTISLTRSPTIPSKTLGFERLYGLQKCALQYILIMSN